MPNPVLGQLETSVTNAVGAMTSAKTLIDGIGARIQAAVDAAIANGATEAELAPVQTEVDNLNAASTALAQAVAANP